MKKFLALFLLLFLLVSPALAENSKRVIDEADLLSATDEQTLEENLARIMDTYHFDIVILTKESIGDRQGEYFAADYFDDNGYGYGEGKNRDGMIFFYVTQGDSVGNTLHIVRSGKGETIFDYETVDEMVDHIRPYMARKDYAASVARFVIDAEGMLEAHKAVNRANRLAPIFAISGLAIGAVVAFSFKAQMKTVRRKSGAANYIRDGSFRLTRQQDIYLYTTTTRRRIQSDNNRGGGGGHGSFTGGSGTHHTSSSYKM